MMPKTSSTTSMPSNTKNCRWGEVILLDGRSVEILIQPRLFAGDLFDTVASHFDLREKEYFGLAFLDETGQYNWLNLERRVLEHEYAQRIRKRPKPKPTVKPSPQPPQVITKHSDNEVILKNSLNFHYNNIPNQQLFPNHHQHSKPTSKRLLTKSTSRQPNISKLKNLKNKNNQKKLSSSSVSMVNNLVKRPLARLTSNHNKFKSTSSSTITTNDNQSPAPPTPPSFPPPPLPLILDTPEMIKVMSPSNNHKVINAIQRPSSSSTLKTTTTTMNEDPVYNVINNISSNDNDSHQFDYVSPVINNNHNHNHYQNYENNYSELIKPKILVENNDNEDGTNNNIDVDSIDHDDDDEDDDNDIGICDNEEEDYVEDDLDGDVEDDENDNRLTLYFLVKYFVESITMLHDTNTIELFYLQAKSLLINEIVQVDLETSIKLSALILQATFGDYSNYSEKKIRNRIHLLQLITESLLKQLDSYQDCEDYILDEYRQLESKSHGESIYEFMTLIEKQPTYGVHFYEVKDKSGNALWLGLSFKGIDQFSYADRRLPLKQFPWKQLENLYFREKKFSIEVRDIKRVVHTLSSINLYENAIEDPHTFDDLSTAICDPTTQVSVSRRTFGPCNVTVYVWFAANSSLTKCIWSMAIAQHQFYIDRRINKCQKFQRSKDDIVRCLNENYRFQQQQQQLLINHFNTQPQRNSLSSINSSTIQQRHQRNSLYSNTSSIENVQSLSSPSSTPPPLFQASNSYHNSNLGHFSTNSLTNNFTVPSITLNNNATVTNGTSQIKSSSLISLNLESSVGNAIVNQNYSNDNLDGDVLDKAISVSRHNSQTLLPQHQRSSTASASSLFLMNRNTPFRHSTSASSIHKISQNTLNNFNSQQPKSTMASSSLNNNQKKLKMSKQLRQLQHQLQLKMEELNRLDQLEQEILSKASMSQQSQQQQKPQTIKTSIEPQCDAISRLTSSSSSSSISSGSLSSIDNKNIDNKRRPHTSNNVKFNVKAPNSLKNFVVTGRASSSLSQQYHQQPQQQSNLVADSQQQLLPTQQQSISRLGSNLINSKQPKTTVLTRPISPMPTTTESDTIIHQRSKSVGVGSRVSLDKTKNQANSQQQSSQQSQPMIHSTSNIQQQPSISQSITSSSNNSMKPTTNSVIKPTQPLSSSSLFHSPYVNKYDTSVQTLLNDNERTNLYSVPNQRTSVALNSLDDTVLHQYPLNKLPPNANHHHDLSTLNSSTMFRKFLQNKSLAQQQQQQKNQNHSFVTTSVTSNHNTTTYSTLSYQIAPATTVRSMTPPASIISGTTSPIPTSSMIESNVDVVDNSIDNHSRQSPIQSVATTRILGRFVGRNPKPATKLTPKEILMNQLRNLDDENLDQYKTILISRSDSFGSQRSKDSKSSTSSSSNENNTFSTYDKYHHVNMVQSPPKTIESNYANVSDLPPPLPPPMNIIHQPSAIRFASVHNNNDYANLPPSKSSLSKTLELIPNENLRRSTLQNSFNNHIYQNSQNLLKNFSKTTTTQSSVMKPLPPLPTISTKNFSYGPNSEMSSPNRRTTTKTWFETDLDVHHLRQNSSFKPLIKPTMNLVFDNHHSNNANDDNDDEDAHSQASTTIYHPIHLVTDDDDNDTDINENHKNDNRNEIPTKSLLLPSMKTTTSTNLYQNLLTLQQKQQQQQNQLRNSMISPTPSQSSQATSISSCSLKLNHFNSNLKPPIGLTNSNFTLPKRYSSSSTNSTGSSGSLPTPTNGLNNSSFTKNNNGNNGINSSITRPPPAISPICTVAFIPAITQTETLTTNANSKSSSTIVPIASCKGNIVEVDVVTVGHIQPGYEETKPFTIDDFYKYSQRYRQAQKSQTNNNNNNNDKTINNNQSSKIIGSRVEDVNQTLSNRISSLALSDNTNTTITSSTGTATAADDNNNSVTTMVFS